MSRVPLKLGCNNERYRKLVILGLKIGVDCSYMGGNNTPVYAA